MRHEEEQKRIIKEQKPSEKNKIIVEEQKHHKKQEQKSKAKIHKQNAKTKREKRGAIKANPPGWPGGSKEDI